MDFAGAIFLIDSNSHCRAELTAALQSLGWKVEAFPELGDYLRRFDPEAPGCVLLKEVADMEAHRKLLATKRKGKSIQPVIYIPDDFDVASTVDVFRSFTFLLKNSTGALPAQSMSPDAGNPPTRRGRQLRLDRASSIDEAAALWQVGRVTVWRWIKRGAIQASKTKSGYQILPGQVPPSRE